MGCSYNLAFYALDVLGLAVSLTGLYGLASLLDLLENRLVVERVGGGDFCSLGLERNVEGLNT